MILKLTEIDQEVSVEEELKLTRVTCREQDDVMYPYTQYVAHTCCHEDQG